MMNLVSSSAAVIVAMAAASAVWAHHGWSGYEEQVLKLTGTIESATYASPHGSAVLKTQDKTWNVILAPPARMQSRGLTREMLQSGVEATVEGYPHRTDASELRAERITVQGKTIELR